MTTNKNYVKGEVSYGLITGSDLDLIQSTMSVNVLDVDAPSKKYVVYELRTKELLMEITDINERTVRYYLMPRSIGEYTIKQEIKLHQRDLGELDVVINRNELGIDI